MDSTEAGSLQEYSAGPDATRANRKIVFAGSPAFAVPSLKALLEAGCEVIGVITRPDRPAGRGRKRRPGPVKEFAAEKGLEVMQPETLATVDMQARLRSMRPDLVVVAAYGLLLPPAVLEIPRAGCVNLHASVLPRWRGASPIQAAIRAGDRVSGVSIMRMERGLDSGPVYATREIAIGARETAGALELRLAEAGAELLLCALPGIFDGSCVPQSQEEAQMTYAGRIDKTDALINWNDAAIAIDRQIRAYNPWPVAETLLDGLRLRCWSAELEPESNPGIDAVGRPGEVIGVPAGFVDVKTGQGVLRLTEVQLPGRRKMSAAEFANGFPVLGKVLGR